MAKAQRPKSTVGKSIYRKEAKREPAGKPGLKANKSKPAFGRFKPKEQKDK